MALIAGPTAAKLIKRRNRIVCSRVQFDGSDRARTRTDFRANAVNAMGHLCDEIDEKIAHFKDLARAVADPQTIRSIDILIAEMEARKDALHPERE
jgi:hypothetical protein